MPLAFPLVDRLIRIFVVIALLLPTFSITNARPATALALSQVVYAPTQQNLVQLRPILPRDESGALKQSTPVYLPIRYETWQTASQPQTLTAGSPLPATLVTLQQVDNVMTASGPMFIENVGQFDPQARFLVRGDNGSLFLTEDGLWYTFLDQPQTSLTQTLKFHSISSSDEPQPINGVHLKLNFPGANPHPRLEPFSRLDTHISYFIGADPTQWHADVPVWGGVRYVDLYPGIDLELTTENGQIQQRFIAHNESQLANVRLHIEGAQGVQLDSAVKHSKAYLTTAIGEVALPLFKVESASSNSNLSAPTVTGDEITTPFAIGRRAPGLQSLPFQGLYSTLAFTNTSDLRFSTYLGGSGTDTGYGIAVDNYGSAYVVGTTSSTNFTTTTGAYSTILSGMSDVFVTKIAADGSAIIYSTYLGGNGYDEGRDIAVDANGSAYVTGYTTATFPISGAISSNNAGGTDAFITKLNADGTNLIYSTYLGGAGDDIGNGIALNSAGEAYIVGSTTSATTFPIYNALQPTFQGGTDAFVTKISAAGSSILYSTFLSGSSNPYTTLAGTKANDVAVDLNNAAYIVGSTNAADFITTTGAFQPTWGGGQCIGSGLGDGCDDAFVTKIVPNGSALAYSTYLEGSGIDRGNAIAIDKDGRAYITGETEGYGFPTTTGAFQRTNTSQCDPFTKPYCPDAFLTILKEDGSGVSYSTLLGGGYEDYGNSIAVDAERNVFVVGALQSFDFPTTSPALQTNCLSNGCAFITIFGINGSLEYSTFVGGTTGVTSGYGIATTDSGVTYITGQTSATSGFPILQALQSSNGGSYDTFVTKLGITSIISRSAWTRSCPLCSLYDALHNIAGPINTSSGNYTYQKTDETIPVLGGALSFERSYIGEARDLYTRTLGYGWTHDQDIRLVFPTDPGGVSGQIQLQAPGGSQLPFFDRGDGSYQAYPGVTAHMSRIMATGGITTYVVTATNQTVYTFNSSGLVTQTVSPAGNVITYTYYPTGSLESVQSYGRSLRFYYDTQNRLQQVLDPIDRSTQFGYDDNGDLSTVTDTHGLMWTYEYSETTHLLTRVLDPDQKTIERTEYDDQGRAIKQYNGNDELVTQLQFGSGGTITVTDGLTRTSVDHYGRGAWLGGTDSASQAITRTYDANFKPTYVADPNGNGPQMKWGANGSNLEQVTDAQGLTTTMAYDDLNNLKQITDTRGFTTSYTYSGTFLTGKIDAYGNTWIYTPTADGHNLLAAELAPGERLTEYQYDQYGQRTVVTDALRNATHYEYDAVGRLITTTDPIGRVTINAYDDADHLIAVTSNYITASTAQNYLDAWNLIARYGYDGFGRQIAVTDTLGHIMRNDYDAAGRLISTTANFTTTEGVDPVVYNLTTWYGYDAVGNRTLVTDTLLHVTRTDYDNLNRPVTVTTNYQDGIFNSSKPDEDIQRITHYDPAGNVIEQIDPPTVSGERRITRAWYDSLNRVFSTTVNFTTTLSADPDTYNLTTWYEYDPAGNQTAITDTVKHVTRNYYDRLGRLISTTINYSPTLDANALDQYNLTTWYEYDAVGNRVAITDAMNTPTRYTYDKLNRVIATANVSGTTYTQYNALGNRVAVTDALTHTTVYTYDDMGRLIVEGNPVIGNVTQYQYDALGRTVVVTDPLGHPTRTCFDDAGRAVSITNALTGTAVTVYDALGRRSRLQDARGYWTDYGYDGLGRTIAVTDATGSVMLYGYDALGNRVVVTDPLTHTTTYTYDVGGRLIAQVDALGNMTHTVYDRLGNRIAVTNANGIATGYGYDALNRLARVTESLTTTQDLNPNRYNVVTTYQYDALGNRTVMTNARGYPATYTYDALSRLVTLTDPLTHTTHYSYDAAGNRTHVVDANGGTITYTFDAINRNSGIDYGTSIVTFEYDAAGNRTAMTDTLGTTHYVYDELNRLTQATDPFTGTVQYHYDAVGNRTNLIYPDGKVVTYTFDAANRLTETLSWDGQATTYDFDAAGRLITTTLPNGVAEVNTYDAANRQIYLSQQAVTRTLGQYEYVLDGVGNRVWVTETQILRGGVAPEQEPFFSDNFNDNNLNPAWSTYLGTWSEANGGLSQTSTEAGDPQKAILSNSGVNFASNPAITARVRVDSWTDGDYARAGVGLFTSTDNGEGYNLVFHNDHTTVQFLDDHVEWGPSYSFEWSDDTWYWFKLKMEDGTLWGKVWADGTSEPET